MSANSSKYRTHFATFHSKLDQCMFFAHLVQQFFDSFKEIHTNTLKFFIDQSLIERLQKCVLSLDKLCDNDFSSSREKNLAMKKSRNHH